MPYRIFLQECSLKWRWVCYVVCSSMRSSPSSDLGSSLEPPASPFQQQQRSSIGPDRLQALLGRVSSDGPPVPQSGFSAALITPRSESSLSRSGSS